MPSGELGRAGGGFAAFGARDAHQAHTWGLPVDCKIAIGGTYLVGISTGSADALREMG
jgi:hypothetical protein